MTRAELNRKMLKILRFVMARVQPLLSKVEREIEKENTKLKLK